MAQQKKALQLLNDSIEFAIEPDLNGSVAVQYGAFGADGVTAATGTIVVEVSLNGVEWYPLKITLNDKTDADNLLAPGIGHSDFIGYTRGRVRMSVVGGAQGVTVWTNERAG